MKQRGLDTSACGTTRCAVCVTDLAAALETRQALAPPRLHALRSDFARRVARAPQQRAPQPCLKVRDLLALTPRDYDRRGVLPRRLLLRARRARAIVALVVEAAVARDVAAARDDMVCEVTRTRQRRRAVVVMPAGITGGGGGAGEGARADRAELRLDMPEPELVRSNRGLHFGGDGCSSGVYHSLLG